jgi:hypothetical protein
VLAATSLSAMVAPAASVIREKAAKVVIAFMDFWSVIQSFDT